MEFCDCGRQATAACAGCSARVCVEHSRYVPSPPVGIRLQDVELPKRLFSSLARSSVLCSACLDTILTSWAADLAESIKGRGLSREEAALELLQRWGWYEPYTGPRRAEQRLSGPLVLAEVFGEAPAWAMESAVKTAAFLYSQIQRHRGAPLPAHRIEIWDQTPENVISTQTCRLWEIESWDSDAGQVFLWIGERGGCAPAPFSLQRSAVHSSDWTAAGTAIATAAADPLLPAYDQSPDGLENRHMSNLLAATVDARRGTEAP